jgi:hypothetical protein
MVLVAIVSSPWAKAPVAAPRQLGLPKVEASSYPEGVYTAAACPRRRPSLVKVSRRHPPPRRAVTALDGSSTRCGRKSIPTEMSYAASVTPRWSSSGTPHSSSRASSRPPGLCRSNGRDSLRPPTSRYATATGLKKACRTSSQAPRSACLRHPPPRIREPRQHCGSLSAGRPRTGPSQCPLRRDRLTGPTSGSRRGGCSAVTSRPGEQLQRSGQLLADARPTEPYGRGP